SESSASTLVRQVEDGLLAIHPETGEDVLMGARCTACDTTVLRRAAICPSCWAEGTLQPVALPREGTLYSVTVIHQAPPGFEPPYAMGYVDLGATLRMMARVALSNSRPPPIGQRVRLTRAIIARSDDGTPIEGPLFVPATE